MQTKLTVYPELKFIDRAWRVSNVYTSKEMLDAAGIPILGEHQIPSGMVYAQSAVLHDLDKIDMIKAQNKKMHELVLAVNASNDVIKQKNIELAAKQFVCCGSTAHSVESWDLVSTDDELLQQIAKKLADVCKAWEIKHGMKLYSNDLACWTDGKFDAMITASNIEKKNVALQDQIKQLTSGISIRNQIIASLVLGFFIEQMTRYIFH
jgi:hypothetical protein